MRSLWMKYRKEIFILTVSLWFTPLVFVLVTGRFAADLDTSFIRSVNIGSGWCASVPQIRPIFGWILVDRTTSTRVFDDLYAAWKNGTRGAILILTALQIVPDSVRRMSTDLSNTVTIGTQYFSLLQPWIKGFHDKGWRWHICCHVIFVLDFQYHCGLRTENDIPARIQGWIRFTVRSKYPYSKQHVISISHAVQRYRARYSTTWYIIRQGFNIDVLRVHECCHRTRLVQMCWLLYCVEDYCTLLDQSFNSS